MRRISDRASVRIAGEPTDPCHVIAGRRTNLSTQEIRVEIDVRVVLHELQQCGVDVTPETLLTFLTTDSQSEHGRDAYITFARFVINPVPPLSGIHHVVTPRWVWAETTAVAVDDGLVKFEGRCVPA